jgi:hypothetical protein
MEQSMSKDQMARLTANAAIEESVSANRPPKVVQGLTQFLRTEYNRFYGVWSYKTAGEAGKLMQFWKDHVSEAYRKKREEKLAMRESMKRGARGPMKNDEYIISNAMGEAAGDMAALNDGR